MNNLSHKTKKTVHYYCGCRYHGNSPSTHCIIHQQGIQYAFMKEDDVLDTKKFINRIKKNGGKLIKDK